MPGGRPTDYSVELAATICARLVEGESLRSICRDDAMPSLTAVFTWLAKHSEFADQYARAREEQAETLASEIIDIADGDLSVEDTAVVTARDRLRVDARKWVAAKLKPKVYGEKIQQEHTGADGKDLIPSTIVFQPVAPRDPDVHG